MAGSVNKVILVGNLGKDPEIRRTQDGRPIANLSVATSESWRDKGTGERKEKTEWHRVVIFNKNLAEVAEKYLRKGSKVYVEGRIEIYFRSLRDQSVTVAGRRFDFVEGERVHTEYSYKYDVAGIDALARSGSFRIAETWTDPERLFAVVYLEATP